MVLHTTGRQYLAARNRFSIVLTGKSFNELSGSVDEKVQVLFHDLISTLGVRGIEICTEESCDHQDNDSEIVADLRNYILNAWVEMGDVKTGEIFMELKKIARIV